MKKEDVTVTVENGCSDCFWRTQVREGREEKEISPHRTRSMAPLCAVFTLPETLMPAR
jgi:hypothetical protein